jgi:hypothetical protein
VIALGSKKWEHSSITLKEMKIEIYVFTPKLPISQQDNPISPKVNPEHLK